MLRDELCHFDMPYYKYEYKYSQKMLDQDREQRKFMFESGTLSCIEISDSEAELQAFMRVQKQFALSALIKEKRA